VLAPGDTVYGELRAADDIDELTVELPRGTVARWDVRRASPGRLLPSVGMFDADYAPVGIAIVPPSFIDSQPVPRSGTYRFPLKSGNDELGAYRVRFTALPQRTASAGADGDAAPDPLVFGAFPGATVDVVAKWKGPSPVTVTLAGPGGVPLAAPAGPVVRGSASTQRGFPVTALGDQAATIVVPAGTERWSVKLAIRTPKFRGTTHDLRSADLPVPDGVSAAPTALFKIGTSQLDFLPRLDVAGEEGGPDAWIVGSSGDRPNALPVDGRRGGCGFQPFDGGLADATEYRFGCSAGFDALVHDVARDAGGLVVSFSADLQDPWGTGTTALSGFAYDAAGRPSAWTETRRYDATGNVHVLEVSAVTRFPDGALRTFTLRHTPPGVSGGAVRTYQYGPYQ
jgi:hypothetical protein